MSSSLPDSGSRRLEYLLLNDLVAAPRNAKLHAAPDIKRSIAKFGYVDPVIIDERTGRLVSGHGRAESLRGAHASGDAAPEGIQVDQDGSWRVPVLRGWSSRSDEEAEAYLVAANRLTEKGGWDERELAEMLGDLQQADVLDLTGYDEDDLQSMVDAFDDADDADTGGAERPDKGEALKLAGVTVGEPEFEVATGDVWRLGQHLLVVADVHQGWQLWAPMLQPGDLLWPYPTLLAPFTDQADDSRVVMVQPNRYLAGWLLTKWRRIAKAEPLRLDDAAIAQLSGAAS